MHEDEATYSQRICVEEVLIILTVADSHLALTETLAFLLGWEAT